MTVAALCRPAWADGWSGTSQAPNRLIGAPASGSLEQIGGITNTRHNLTQAFTSNASFMNSYRNNYFEVCVYCHTPHAANSTAAAPLWNRTVQQRSYQLYSTKSEPTALDLPQTQPGPNSLTCLSCHDGATAIDSIINMPTLIGGANIRAGYQSSQQTSVDTAFLDRWRNASVGSGADLGHAGFNTTGSACLTCHNPAFTGVPQPPDFRLFSIGDEFGDRNAQDLPNRKANYLADDHPIGVKYPSAFGVGIDYNAPSVTKDRIAFFDLNGNGHSDPNEVRLYDSGDGYEVECGSCHDPHGVALTGSDNRELIPSFLRVGDYVTTSGASISANSGSKLCLTCHVK